MSYEGEMLESYEMPTRIEVEKALLISLFNHDGTIKEFGSDEAIVDEIADKFGLNKDQRTASLQTVYRKENRIKHSILWHRLLFRAADSLVKGKLVSRPTSTYQITGKKEWMLTENGFDKALKLLNIPQAQKPLLSTKSFEVQKVVKRLTEAPSPKDYNPFDEKKKAGTITKESAIRTRGFRQAIIEAYEYRCAFCGMKINSPDSLSWEVEAAHIVPHGLMGKDDIWNGLALCHLHHWAFDVGWFTLGDDYNIQVSSKIHHLPPDFGKVGGYDLIRSHINKNSKVFLPKRTENYPHRNAISWHRENKFFR